MSVKKMRRLLDRRHRLKASPICRSPASRQKSDAPAKSTQAILSALSMAANTALPVAPLPRASCALAGKQRSRPDRRHANTDRSLEHRQVSTRLPQRIIHHAWLVARVGEPTRSAAKANRQAVQRANRSHGTPSRHTTPTRRDQISIYERRSRCPSRSR